MRSSSSSIVVISFIGVIAACGGGEAATLPPKVEPAPKPVTASAEVKAPEVSAAPPVAATIVAEPTVLTDEQKKRDTELAAKLTPYVDAYSNIRPRLSKDRKSLLFLSNRDGLWQAYSADPTKPAAAPKKLTSGTERVTEPDFTRDGKYVLFLGDQGADENFRIFRMALDGSALTNLTPGAKMHRDPPLLPRLRPGVMIYSGRDVKESKTHVFTQDIAGTEPKEFYVDPQPASITSVSPDGQHVLLVRERSASDQILFRVDVDGGKATQLYPQPGKTAHITDAQYSGDGKRVFLSTDDGGQSSFVVMMEPGANSGVIAGRYKEEIVPTASIEGISVSPKDDRIAISVDAGNHNEVRILNASTLKLQGTVKSPLGTANPGEFSEDGKVFTMRLGTPDRPTDVFEVDAATGATKPLRADVRPGLKDMPAMDATIEKVAAFDGLSIPMNVYLPKARNGKLPVIVYVHGGPSGNSKLGWSGADRFMVSQGFAMVAPNLRGSTGFGRSYEMADNREKRGDALKDLESVNKWVKDQTWADKDRVIIYGGSYGGYITLMALSRQPTLWRAGVDLVGISNLVSFLQSTSQDIRSFFVDEFGDLDKDRALLEQWSPIKDVDKIVAPLFVYQGQNDPRVPRPESDLIVSRLRGRNIPTEYMVLANEGHSLDRRESRIEFMSRVVRFLGDQTKDDTKVDTKGAPGAKSKVAPQRKK